VIASTHQPTNERRDAECLCPPLIEGINMNTSPTRLGTEGAAAYLGGIAEGTLRYWRYQGIGPHSYRLGRHTFYDVADLDAFVAEQKATTQRGSVSA
jgi:hypothetical protein